jgi:hypothetical protein
MPDSAPRRTAQAKNMSEEKYARLRAEAKAPYRGLRKFAYATFGASGLIGAFVFLAQVAAGRDLGNALPNLAFTDWRRGADGIFV